MTWSRPRLPAGIGGLVETRRPRGWSASPSWVPADRTENAGLNVGRVVAPKTPDSRRQWRSHGLQPVIPTPTVDFRNAERPRRVGYNCGTSGHAQI